MAQRLRNAGKNGGEKGIVSPEVVLEARREITSSKTQLEQAQADHRNTCKRWKNQGVNTKALIEVIQLRRQEPETVTAHFRDVFRYGRIEKAEFAMQLNLFQQVVDFEPTGKARETHAEFEAEEAGYVAGRRGFTQDGAPGQPGDKAHSLYLKGWKRGQKQIAKQLGKNATVATAKPRKGKGTGTTRANAGRRKGAGAPPPAAAAAPDQPTLLQ